MIRATYIAACQLLALSGLAYCLVILATMIILP